MRKFRILAGEVIGLGILIGWLLWKYPELIDGIIPWVALLVAWHITWECVLDTRGVRHLALAMGRRVNPVFSWLLVFLLGGAISVLYWVGINKSLVRLAAVAAQRASQKNSATPDSPNKTPSPPEPVRKIPSSKPNSRPKVNQPIQIAPSYGNLKERTLVLAQDIESFYQERMKREERIDPARTVELHKIWVASNDTLFDSQYWESVVSVRNECAGFHQIRPELDRIIERHQKELQRRRDNPQLPAFVTSIDISDIREIGVQLAALASQLK
jgi:hypothetical protein